MANPVIEKTTNYDIFKPTKKNRKTSPKHVKNLMQSFMKENYLHLRPIIVNESLEVVDGQHRLLAAKALKVPIFYIKSKTSDLFVNTANILQKQARLDDTMNYFAKWEGVEQYKILAEFNNKLKFLSLGSLLSLIGVPHKQDRLITLQYGDLKFNEPYLIMVDIIERYKEVREVLVKYPLKCPSSIKSLMFCRAFYEFYKMEIDWKHFMHRIHIDWNELDKVFPKYGYWVDLFIKVYGKRCSKNKLVKK